jgi:ABC-2 type transport system permease protein
MSARSSPASGWSALRREAAFLARDRSAWAWWLVVLCLSILAVSAGLSEVHRQKATIAHLIEADRAERMAVLKTRKDWIAVYHSFHLTFDPPSEFAFAALGRRDDAAWKHRVRMLALEGQIHERDAGHPVLALVGRFDFAFLAAFVLPLVLIVLLHDLRAGERVAGRHDLLLATAAGDSGRLWRLRAGLRAGGVFIAAALPLGVAAGLSGTAAPTLLAAGALLFVYVLFWTLVCAGLAAWQQTAEVILATLVALWMLLGVVVPAAGRIVIDRAVPMPSGADIVMTQREAVNAGWDLPKATTMAAFVERHPQWAGYTAIERPFEWKWYFAFQQVGDQQAQAVSEAYTAGRIERDRLAGWLAVIAPPVLFERTLQVLARTDVRASLAYEAQVRAFHASLRAFYYPRLFRDERLEPTALEGLPEFSPRVTGH